MARDAQALKIRKWAATGERDDPDDVGLSRNHGWGLEYSLLGNNKFPERKVFNQLLRELTGLFSEINTRGILEWDASIGYVHPAFAAYNNDLYRSRRNSTGENPMSSPDAWEVY